MTRLKVTLLMVLFMASCSDSALQNVRAIQSNQDSQLNSDDEEIADELVTIPSNISGSFLTCAQVTQENVGATSKSVLSCSVNNLSNTSPLAFDKKATKEAKDLVHSNFELSLLPSPGAVTYE